MEGKHITVSVGQMPPYITTPVEDGKIQLDGYFGKVWMILQDRLGFKSNFIIENFEDAVFYATTGFRDVILYPSVISSKDINNVEFTVPLLRSWYFLYIKDSDEANSSESFIRNWSGGLWVSTVLMILIFTIFLYVMLKIVYKCVDLKVLDMTAVKAHVNDTPNERKEWQENFQIYNKARNLNEGSLGNCFIHILAALCSQGCDLYFRLTSLRMLKFTILMFGMIMCSSYSALLVSQLTLRERFLPFSALSEIPHRGTEYSLCVRKDSYPYNDFKINESTTLLQRKWSTIINRKPCVDGIIPPDVMCAPKMAFLETPAVMQSSISANFMCKITNLKGKYNTVEYSILLRKGFDRKGILQINLEIIRYREVGILAHLLKKHVRQDGIRSPAEDAIVQVTYDHIAGVLLIYCCCIGISFMVFLIETFTKQVTRFMRHTI